VEEAQEFWLIDCDGRRLWRKHVPSELGDDPHIDDFLVDQILPVDRLPGKQVLLVTGPNLVDRDGRVIWSARDRFDHAQKVLAADLRPEIPGKEVYTVESFKRRAHLLSCDADAIWTYENFTRVREGVVPPDPHRGQAIGRLTTAGDLVNWSGRGKVEIAQAEMGGADVHGPRVGVPPHAMRWFLHVIDRAGQPVQIFPIDDSPMCVRSAHVTASPCDDLVVVGHTNSRICIYSRKC
jgi:hypothetical protein